MVKALKCILLDPIVLVLQPLHRGSELLDVELLQGTHWAHFSWKSQD